MKKNLLSSLIIIASFLVGCDVDKSPTQYKVFLLQPVYDEAANYTMMNPEQTPIIPIDGYDDASILELAATSLANSSNCVFENHVKNTPITKEVIKSLGQNQIIFFQGHGNYLYDKDKIGIETGAVYDEEKYNSDIEYKNDVDNGLICDCFFNEVITAEYITKYCNNLTNSIVYLGQCETCHEIIEYNDYDEVVSKSIDESLVNAFLNKGASAVIANTHMIGMRYGNLLEYITIKLLGDINSDTGKKYTIGEALSEAKATYSEKDLNTDCEATLFGNQNWRME